MQGLAAVAVAGGAGRSTAAGPDKGAEQVIESYRQSGRVALVLLLLMLLRLEGRIRVLVTGKGWCVLMRGSGSSSGGDGCSSGMLLRQRDALATADAGTRRVVRQGVHVHVCMGMQHVSMGVRVMAVAVAQAVVGVQDGCSVGGRSDSRAGAVDRTGDGAAAGAGARALVMAGVTGLVLLAPLGSPVLEPDLDLSGTEARDLAG